VFRGCSGCFGSVGWIAGGVAILGILHQSSYPPWRRAYGLQIALLVIAAVTIYCQRSYEKGSDTMLVAAELFAMIAAIGTLVVVGALAVQGIGSP
jgi:hypothetical protein